MADNNQQPAAGQEAAQQFPPPQQPLYAQGQYPQQPYLQPGQPLPGQPVPGQVAPGQQVPGQPVAGEQAVGQVPAGQPYAGQQYAGFQQPQQYAGQYPHPYAGQQYGGYQQPQQFAGQYPVHPQAGQQFAAPQFAEQYPQQPAQQQLAEQQQPLNQPVQQAGQAESAATNPTSGIQHPTGGMQVASQEPDTGAPAAPSAEAPAVSADNNAAANAAAPFGVTESFDATESFGAAAPFDNSAQVDNNDASAQNAAAIKAAIAAKQTPAAQQTSATQDVASAPESSAVQETPEPQEASVTQETAAAQESPASQKIPTAKKAAASKKSQEDDKARDVFERRARKRVILFSSLIVLLVLGCLTSISLGQYSIPFSQVWALLFAGPQEGIVSSVMWDVRIPRIVLGILVGASLGVAGALMQAVFANPLAEPSIIGVTSGAGVGAALVIVFEISILGTFTVPFGAFISALLATLIIYQLARFRGKVAVLNLILTGIAINAVCGAIISFMVYLAPTTNREQIIFWQMGSLNGSQWKHVWVVLPIAIVGIAIAIRLARNLDTLALGERAATHTGVNVARLRIFAIGASTILTAGAVAFAGLIGFVGLIVPHVLRTIVGPENKILVPTSALAGAVLIVIADLAARTMIPFADLPIGIFTALVGGPTFFILLRRMLRRGVH